MSAPSDLAAAAQTLVNALAAACANPADALRLLGELAQFTPSAFTPSGPIGDAMAGMQDACGDLLRRTAVIALAKAATTYQPSSYNDAITVMATVTGLIDNEIEVAGDQAEDDTFTALRALRLAVVLDLNARGANLAPIVTFDLPGSLPAAAAALKIYGDPSRSDQLVTQVDPVHPLFLPPSFQALAD